MAQVLIVDGDEAISETMRYILEEAGHSVLEMPDYAEALAHLRTAPSCCVVLFDRSMRWEYDTAFVAAITGDERLATRHAYICLTTAPLYLKTAEMSVFDRLAIPVVAKPFDIDDLEEVVRRSAQICALVSSPQVMETCGTVWG